MSNPTLTAGSQFVSHTTKIRTNPDQYIHSADWKANPATNTNITVASAVSQVFGTAGLAAGSVLGIPQISQAAQASLNAMANNDSLSGLYNTLPINKLQLNKMFPPVLYADFRSRLNIDVTNDSISGWDKAAAFLQTRRLDGASSALRSLLSAGKTSIASVITSGGTGAAYAAASASPYGAYSVFNLDGDGNTGYGWGDQGNPYAIRADFTARSHVAKRWSKFSAQAWDSDAAGNPISFAHNASTSYGDFVPTNNPIEKVTPFIGDRVNVIDFGKRTEAEAYLWNPNALNISSDNVLGKILNKTGITQDFIKFYLTGPAMQNGANATDDIIVFRAILTSLTDSFSPQWNSVQMVGRADPNYHYSSVTRDLSLDFIVAATDRDEMQPIWRKLNALAGYTAPTYLKDSIAMQAPWMRITIGDLFRQQPVLLTSLTYTLVDSDTTWEINIEDDPTMMQAPHKVSVSCQFTVISDYLPQKNGRFYTLAKQFKADGTPIRGNDNWLSDSLDNANAKMPEEEIKRWKNRVRIKTKVEVEDPITTKTKTE